MSTSQNPCLVSNSTLESPNIESFQHVEDPIKKSKLTGCIDYGALNYNEDCYYYNLDGYKVNECLFSEDSCLYEYDKCCNSSSAINYDKSCEYHYEESCIYGFNINFSDSVIHDLDVIYMTRIQDEHGGEGVTQESFKFKLDD